MSAKSSIEWTEKDEAQLRAIKVALSRSGKWQRLDETPLMPESKADPSYGGRDHRFIALAPARMRWLVARLKERI